MTSRYVDGYAKAMQVVKKFMLEIELSDIGKDKDYAWRWLRLSVLMGTHDIPVNKPVINLTKSQINEYTKTLDGIMQELYKSVEETYILTLHDTLSDEFQIIAEIQNVFTSYANKRITTKGE